MIRETAAGTLRDLGIESDAVRRRGSPFTRHSWIGGALLSCLVPCVSAAEGATELAASVEQLIVSAESSLAEGEREIAESRYRSALLEGWLLVGALDLAEKRLLEAKQAFERASTSAVEAHTALQSLALVHLQTGEAEEAATILTRLAARRPKDVPLRRLLAQALVSAGHPEQAVQELEEVRSTASEDLELAFALASGYLRLKRVDAAARLFAQIVKGRPIPQTHVLIGRTYRDHDEYDRARTELQAALAQDPRVRRAHYYLGMVAVLAEGVNKLDEAIAEFRQELKITPQDSLTHLRLGMALVEARRPAEALPSLELVARQVPPQTIALLYLGRCLLGLDRPVDAAGALRRALAVAEAEKGNESQLGAIHYQLAQALRKQGATEDAATHFAAAERYQAQMAQSSREQLARYMADVPEGTSAAPLFETSPLAKLSPAERQQQRRRLTTSLARAYLNLGVMQAQGERFARAAGLFESAAAVDPDFPQVQYSLGVAHFNAKNYDKAVGPLARAFDAGSADATLRRMLALSWLNTESYEKAAELLRDDPARESNPSLQYAYGLALVRSQRAAEAQAVFSRLLAAHGDSPELSVVLGQAHADQGDYESAIRVLTRARELKPDVAEANGILGVIFLKQGRLDEAAEALRAEIKAHPSDAKSQHNLATVLDLQGHPEDAVPLLRSALKTKPDFADARYLLGKILLAEGAADEAVEQLEAAVRLAPEDANVHFQLGRAYEKVGRSEPARQQFEAYQKLKERRRGATP